MKGEKSLYCLLIFTHEKSLDFSLLVVVIYNVLFYYGLTKVLYTCVKEFMKEGISLYCLQILTHK